MIILFFTGHPICKDCQSVLLMEFADETHNRITLTHTGGNFSSCKFAGQEKEFSYEKFELK